MHTARTIMFGAALFVAGLLAGNLDISTGTAQNAYPTELKGVSGIKLGIVPEDSMIKQTGLDGYFLQLRRVTVEPGGEVPRHDHATRPGLVQVLEGTWTEGRPEGEREYPAGSEIALVEDAETEHWFYNRGTEPVVAMICDLGIAK